MGKAGPQPKPTILKELTGNPGRRPLSQNEVKPSSSPPLCPEWLGDIGRQTWDAVMTSMPTGFICRVDGILLAQFCRWAEIFHDSNEVVKSEGLTCFGAKGTLMQRPEFKAMITASDQMKRLSAKYGFTPADRVGLEFGDAPKDDDPLDAILRARAGMN